MALAATSSAGAIPASRSQSRTAPRAARMDYVDALRVVLILLVVAHHSVEAYVARHAPEIVFADAPIPRAWAFLGVNAAFFMGLFFFLAGYYTPGAFDRKGAGRFVIDRLIRLGIPLLLGFILIVPFAGWLRMRLSPGMPYMDFWYYVRHGFLRGGEEPPWWPMDERWPQLSFGWLWFVEHLLIYTLLYALWRALVPRRPGAVPPAPPTEWSIFAYAFLLALATWAIRIWYPQNDWIAFLGFWQMEPAHLPQYASLFVIGLIAGRGRWIETMPRQRGFTWLAVGGGLAIFLYVMAGFGFLEGGSSPPGGTPSLPKVGPVIWESFLCTGMCVGLPVAFRELALGSGALWRMLGRNVLAIYVFHYPIVLAVQGALLATDLPKWARLLLTWPAAVAITVLFTNYLVLRIPGLRRVF